MLLAYQIRLFWGQSYKTLNKITEVINFCNNLDRLMTRKNIVRNVLQMNYLIVENLL